MDESQQKVASSSSAPSSDTIVDITEVHKISSVDKSVGDQLVEIKSKLLKMKKEIAMPPDGKEIALPFSNAATAKAAKTMVLTQVQLQIDFASLLIEGLQVKGHLLKEVPFTDEELLDIQRLASWIPHASKMHSNNLEGVFNALSGFIQNAKGRADYMEKLLENSLTCVEHGKQAVSRSIDNRKLMCAQCVADVTPSSTPLPKKQEVVKEVVVEQ